jgi:hypothetical protein
MFLFGHERDLCNYVKLIFSFIPYVIPNRDFIINGKRLKSLKRLTFAVPELRSNMEVFLDIKPFLSVISI